MNLKFMANLRLRNSSLKSRSPRIRILILRSILTLCIVFTALSALVVEEWLKFGANLPSLNDSSSQIILDRHGQEIRHALSVNGERRYFVHLSEVPDELRDAFILAEDRHFYSHQGVDWAALGRGIFQSISQFRGVSGGSTITMQLVRTLWPELQGAVHKPAQILQALRIDGKYSKDEILSQYLNSIPFGYKISGLGAACRYFFNKTCDHLSLGQIATIAILPRNPSFYLSNPAELLQRRNALLDKMLSKKSDDLVLNQAQLEPIIFTKTKPEFFAPHLTERILNENKGKVQIHTTIDLDLQKSIQELLLVETLNRKGTGDSGAVLVIENETGSVLAYVGSPDFFEPSHGMVDGVRVLRSPGSALKPFVYELALENNWNLFSIVPDIPMIFSTQRAVYEPSNFGGDFSGPRTIREALGNSKNLPALYITSQLGEGKVLNHLRRIGFSSLNHEASHYGVGLALGNGEVSLWDITQAYSSLARLGVAISASYYPENLSRPMRVLSEEAAYLISEVLRDPEARQEEFGRFGPLEFDYEVGVKTGTSSDYRDNWTIGFTKKITVGIWRGNANSKPMLKRAPASRGTGPLFHQIMNLAHRNQTPSWLARPDNVQASRVCALSGHRPGKYCPYTRLELSAKGQAPTHECEFHKSIKVTDCYGKEKVITYVQLPKEYQEWSMSSKVPTLKNQLKEICGLNDSQYFVDEKNENALAIAEPLDRTTYAIDPTIPLSHQEIRFSLRIPSLPTGVKVYANDVQIEASLKDGAFFWPIQKGQFKFYLKKGSTVSNVVNIRVR